MSTVPESINVLYEAIKLQLKKSQDYQNPNSRIRQADHYPRGVNTIIDIMHGKMTRMYSLLETMEKESSTQVNFESIEDSAIDLINYASFFVAYARKKMDGQNPLFNDIFNRREPIASNAFDGRNEYYERLNDMLADSLYESEESMLEDSFYESDETFIDESMESVCYSPNTKVSWE